MKITYYSIKTASHKKLDIALVPDIHNAPHDEIIEKLSSIKPDMIAVAGDLMSSLGKNADKKTEKKNERGYAFLRKACAIAPTFYSLGNHESGINAANKEKVLSTGAVFLDNEYTLFDGFAVGGLSSTSYHGRIGKTPVPSLGWIKDFENADGVKILLCHHPEYYPKYLKERNIDIILSGHAHGGQWRIFGQGIYAPGQGIFPKLTSGVHDGRLVISRGLANHNKIPRIFNPPEIVVVTLE